MALASDWNYRSCIANDPIDTEGATFEARPFGGLPTEGGIFERAVKPWSAQAIHRAIERSSERSSARAIGRASDRASDRTSDRATERPNDRATEPSSDRATERSRTDHNSGSRRSFDTLTSALGKIFQN